MKTLAMFPGQGSQYPGMATELLKEFPYVAATFEEASDAIHCDLKKLCNDSDDATLKLTANTQPAILTVSVATFLILREEVGLAPTAFAGHSLGEYSALVCSNKLQIADAVVLVRKRGEAMQRAVPEGVGAMAAIMQVPADELKALCDDCSHEQSRVEIANYNSPVQIVVAGHKKAVVELCRRVKAVGKRAVTLPVSAPFHSGLMAPAKEEMRPLLLGAKIRSESAENVYANLTGNIEQHQAVHLIDQIDHPVLWTQTIVHSSEKMAIERQVEVGPGSVLCGLSRRILERGRAQLISTDGGKLRESLDTLKSSV